MKFNNILNKNEYLKINEAMSEGGSGGLDRGFANNAALQETLLGQLINGVFKSVSWLWRKSKENFVINKLIGRLTNELLRGVIIYCFDNNINIQNGEYTASENENDENDGENIEDDENFENDEKELLDDNENKELDRNIEDLDIIRKDIPDDLTNPSREIIKNTFDVAFDINKVVDIKNIEQFQVILNELYDDLKRNVPNYSNMTPNQKKRVQQLYKNYFISKNIIENSIKQNNLKVNESFKRAPMSDPKSGSDPNSKKINSNVKVSDILTKRDKEKYKEHDEEMNLKLVDINLAEIEKEIEKRNSQETVSKYVNVENLKTIQLMAEELFLPVKTDLYKKPDTQDKTLSSQKLRLKWNKEIRNVYASFSNLMSISKDIDISVKDFREDLTPKLESRAKKNAGYLMNNKKAAETVYDLESKKVIENSNTTFSKLNGNFSLMQINIKNHTYLITCGDVKPYKNDIGFFMRIYNAFEIDDNNLSKSVLHKLKNELGISFIKDNDIWLMFKKGTERSDKKFDYVIFKFNKRDNKLYIIDKKNESAEIEEVHKKEYVSDSDKKFKDDFFYKSEIPQLRLFKTNLTDDEKKQYGFEDNGYAHNPPIFIDINKGQTSKTNFNILVDFYKKLIV